MTSTSARRNLPLPARLLEEPPESQAGDRPAIPDGRGAGAECDAPEASGGKLWRDGGNLKSKANAHTDVNPAENQEKTAGETTVSPTEAIRPRKPPVTAPRVVQSFHSTESSSTGKLAEAATAKASDTMKATLIFSKAMPSNTATTPRHSVAMRETRSSEAESALPSLKSVA